MHSKWQQMKLCPMAHIRTETTYLGETNMREKNIRLPDIPTFTRWKTKYPKVDPCLRVWKWVINNSNMHWQPVKNPQRKPKWMPWLQLCWKNLPKNSSRTSDSKKSWLPSSVGGESGNEAVTIMWRRHFATLLNSSKNCETGNLVKQNINSQGNFEGLITCATVIRLNLCCIHYH